MLDRTVVPKIHPLGDLRLPDLHTETLDNGVELLILDGGTQDVNSLSIAWQGGAVEAPKPSIANLTAALMREGAGGMSGAELSEAIDFRGGIYRADVAEHYSVMSISSVNNLADGLFPLLGKMILEPEYDEHAIEIYRDKEIKTALLQRSKVGYLSQKALCKLIMGEHNPLAREESLDSIASVNRADLVDFHRRAYVAKGCKAFLGGRITDKLYNEVKTLLLSIPQGTESVHLVDCHYREQPPQQVFVSKEGAVQDSVSIAFPAPRRSHPDYVPLRFAVMALGGYFGSRLMKNIREDKGYTYGIQAYLLGGRDGSYVSIGSQCDPRYVNGVIEETKNELRRLATDPMGEEELFRLKQYIATTLIETLDSVFSIMDYYRTMVLASLPTGYFSRQVEVARDLTPGLIMEMAEKYLSPLEMRIAVAGAPFS